jgi:hypothetical protein
MSFFSRRRLFLSLADLTDLADFIVGGEGSQRKDLRHLWHLRENNISARDNMKQ